MALITTDVNITNAALIEIGEQEITAFTDATDRATVANRLYSETVDEVLADTVWGFAKKYHALAESSPQPLVIPGGYATAFDLPNDIVRPVRLEDDEEFDIYNHFSAIAAGPNTMSTVGAVMTSTANGLVVGDYVVLTSGDQEDEIRRVTVDTDVDTVTLEAPFTADQVAGTTWSKASGEKQYLITDASEPKLEYIARVTTPSFWSPGFKQALIKRLASKFALAIVHSRPLAVSLFEEYKALLIDAEAISGQSANRPRKIESRVLVDVRRSGMVRSDKVMSTNT